MKALHPRVPMLRLTRANIWTSRACPLLPVPRFIEAYAEISHYSESVHKPARKLGQNDLWIAATTHVTKATLLTTDKDFDHLHGRYLDPVWIDSNLP